jgi:hypothetical protein
MDFLARREEPDPKRQGEAAMNASLARGTPKGYQVGYGGWILVIGHDHAPEQPPAGSTADPAKRGGERPLDASGRASAVRIGRTHGKPLPFRRKEQRLTRTLGQQ